MFLKGKRVEIKKCIMPIQAQSENFFFLIYKYYLFSLQAYIVDMPCSSRIPIKIALFPVERIKQEPTFNAILS